MDPVGDPELGWSDDGLPRSGRFGDVYFSAEDGLAETRAVFLEGCGLPDAWRGRRRFVVGELGFGSGLNMLALLDLWRRTRQVDATLHIFSVEAFPMAAEDMRRALARWPELADLAALLLARLPPRTPGFHRVDLGECHATLDLAYLEVEAALAAWNGRADAWFLDGFSPATNPEMWREAVLAGVAARSAAGARAATFTVAGAVRRGLEAQGFTPEKRPGFGRKSERLEAAFAGARSLEPARKTVAVIGAGVAGAALCRAFRALGVEPDLIEASAPGAGASGAPAVLVTPRFDAGGGAVARLFAQAVERASVLYHRETPHAVLARGVVQLEHQERDAARFDKVAAQVLWPAGAMARLDADATTARLGEPITRGGLELADGLALDPAGVLAVWLDGVRHIDGEVGSIKATNDGWRVAGADGEGLIDVDIVCLAAGWGAATFAPDAPLSPTRGQVTMAAGVEGATPFAWGGYVAPTRAGVLVGATHDRGDAGSDLRDADNARNLESLARIAPALAARAEAATLSAWCGVRALTPDRLPLAGALAPGLFILGGLGARGFTTAPLLAEHVAAQACGAPSPLPSDLAACVDPGRFRR